MEDNCLKFKKGSVAHQKCRIDVFRQLINDVNKAMFYCGRGDNADTCKKELLRKRVKIEERLKNINLLYIKKIS